MKTTKSATRSRGAVRATAVQRTGRDAAAPSPVGAKPAAAARSIAKSPPRKTAGNTAAKAAKPAPKAGHGAPVTRARQPAAKSARIGAGAALAIADHVYGRCGRAVTRLADAGLLPAPELPVSELEIREWWLVSPLLAERLRAAGMPVVEFAELRMWGRTTAGRSLADDLELQAALHGA